MTVILRSNIRIPDPEEVILRYYQTMGKGVHAYDKVTFPGDNYFPLEQLTEVKRLVNRLGERGIPLNAFHNLIRKEVEINMALARVPTSANILDDLTNLPWDGIMELIDLFRLPYLSLARLTKMLHKKRPDLIPILDSVMVSYLTPFIPREALRQVTDSQKAVEYIKELKKDVEANIEALRAIQNWSGKPYPVSVVRIMDILIWSTLGPFRDRFKHLIIY